jgi:hypothetical protein
MQDQVIHNDDAPLVTIDAAVELVREKTGVPITKSRIHKDSAAGIAPPPDAVYGRRYLWQPENYFSQRAMRRKQSVRVLRKLCAGIASFNTMGSLCKLQAAVSESKVRASRHTGG